MKYLILAFLFLMPLAAAEECIVSDQFERLNGTNIEGMARRLVGNDKTIVVDVNGTEHWYKVENWTLQAVEPGKADLRISTDACTVKALGEGSLDPAKVYEQKKIDIEAETFGSKIRVGLAKILYAIYSVFI